MNPMLIYRSKAQGGKYKRGRLQQVWMMSVAVGDVLVDPWGNHRAVRRVSRYWVSRYSNGDLHSLSFAKRRCSKFERGGTIYLYTELRLGGWRPTGARVELGSEADFLLEVEINTCPCPILVSCCEAKDMP
jgi:hypothetical protein